MHDRPWFLEVVEASDKKQSRGELRPFGLVDAADEKLVETEREDEHDRGEQIAINDFDHMRDNRGAQFDACGCFKAQIVIMQQMFAKQHDVDGGDVEHHKRNHETCHYRDEDDQATVPQQRFESSLERATLIASVSVVQSASF
jgi:hypothetical protein